MNPNQAAFMKVMPFVLGPIAFLVTYKLGAAVQLLLASAAILQYIQVSVFHIGWVRRATGLPPLEELRHKGGPAGPRISPSSNPGGAQYQAPRTVNTTATESTSGSDNPVQAFKGAWSGLQDKLKTYNEKSAVEKTQNKAEEYEKRRTREEHENYLRRREAARRREEK
jgi:hypothetical protein